MIVRMWKICKWICGLPLISVVIGFFKCVYSFFVSIPGKVEKEEKKEKERQEKKANAILGPSNRLFKELGERLAEAKGRGFWTAKRRKRSKKTNLSPVHDVDERDMMSLCANSTMSLSRHGVTSLDSSGKQSKKGGKLLRNKSLHPVMRLVQAKGKCLCLCR